MKQVIGAVLLASAVSLPGFENLNFEQIPLPANNYTHDVPGWQHIGGNSHGGNWWNVNFANVGGWAEASVVYLEDPLVPWNCWPSPPIDGLFSVAFSGSSPAGMTTWGYFGSSVTDYGYTGDENIGRAWIGQTGTIETGSSRLTLLTDYTGPHYTYYPLGNTDSVEVGYLTIYFEGTPVDFTLSDIDTGILGQPLRQLQTDLTPFAGQTGELRIGIEGPHTFLIDNIQFVPEPSSVSLLLAPAGGLVARRMLGR